MGQNADYAPLTQQQRYDLYHAIQAKNPSADKSEVRRLYRAALQGHRAQIDSSGEDR